MTYKFFYRWRESNVEVTVSAGADREHTQPAGKLRFTEAEWQQFRFTLGIGARKSQATMLFQEVGPDGEHVGKESPR